MTSESQLADQEEDGVSTVDEGASTMEDGASTLEDSVCGVLTLDEARRVITELRSRHRAQAHQLLACKRRVNAQEELLGRMTRERNEQLRVLSSQLLLFEARLCRKQQSISVHLAQRDAIIVKQQRTIKQLQSRLIDAGLDCADETNLDSLNDSDSAVIMEDDDYRHGVTVIRSVSDALETPVNCKYSSVRRNNGFLRRPEVLETVYSVEEDGDSDQPQTSNQFDSGIEEPSTHTLKTPKVRLKDLYGSFERLDQDQPPEPVTTYNRVMSNHRSVTKPKDVKYKRINKAKSKSLEELRGRLKNWVEKGSKIAISLDQSFN